MLNFEICVKVLGILGRELTYPRATNFGPGSSVGIETDYGLDGPGIDSRSGEIFRTCPNWSWGPPPASCKWESGLSRG